MIILFLLLVGSIALLVAAVRAADRPRQMALLLYASVFVLGIFWGFGGFMEVYGLAEALGYEYAGASKWVPK